MNEKDLLTLQDLKEMKPGIFVSGYSTIDSVPIQWVAVRGDIHDWAIYYGNQSVRRKDIRDWGAKLHDREKVADLVPCDKEALGMYRD